MSPISTAQARSTPQNVETQSTTTGATGAAASEAVSEALKANTPAPAQEASHEAQQDPAKQAAGLRDKLTDQSKTPAERVAAVKDELSKLDPAARNQIARDAIAGVVARGGADINPVQRVKEEQALSTALTESKLVTADVRRAGVTAGIEKARTTIDQDVVTAMEGIYAKKNLGAESAAQAAPAAEPVKAPTTDRFGAVSGLTAAESKPTVAANPAPAPAKKERFDALDGLAAPGKSAEPVKTPPTAKSEPAPQKEPTKIGLDLSALSGALANADQAIKDQAQKAVDSAKTGLGLVKTKESPPAVKAETKAPEAVKPAPESPAPAAAQGKTPEVVKPVVEAAAPAVKPEAKIASPLSEAQRVNAVALGEQLAASYSSTSYNYGAIVNESKLAIARAERDAKANGESINTAQFKEAVVRTFMEKAIRGNERALADKNSNTGHDVKREICYDIGSKIVGEKQAAEIAKDVAGERVKEILAQKSDYKNGADNIARASGLAHRFELGKQDAAISTERAEIKQSAAAEVDAVLSSDSLTIKEKKNLISAVMDSANRGSGDSIVKSDLNGVFKEYTAQKLEESRTLPLDKRRQALKEMVELAEAFDQDEAAEIKADLDTMRSEIASSLLKDGAAKIIDDKHLTWDQTAEKLRELRYEALTVSGVETKEANAEIEAQLKKSIAGRTIESLKHAKETLEGVDKVCSKLGLASAAEEEMRESVRMRVRENLIDLTAKETAKVDSIITQADRQMDLDDREKAARRYIADVSKVGDDVLAHEIAVKLGTHAVETILADDLPIKVSMEERADEAEDLAHSLEIKPEAAQVVARFAEERYGDLKGSPEELLKMKDDLYEITEEFYLRPQDVKESKSELKVDASKRLQSVQQGIDSKIVAAAEAAREEAQRAAAARTEKAYQDVKDILGRDDIPVDQRIAEVKALQKENSLDSERVKELAAAKVDELAGRKKVAPAYKLATAFGVELE